MHDYPSEIFPSYFVGVLFILQLGVPFTAVMTLVILMTDFLNPITFSLST